MKVAGWNIRGGVVENVSVSDDLMPVRIEEEVKVLVVEND
jgi:hypothetical protein